MVVRRELVLGRAWLALPEIVVVDDGDVFVTYLAEGAPFGFAPGPWPTADGRHPWSGRDSWHGHGTLIVQRPGDMHAVWHFWTGPERTFACWYVNLQQPMRRTAIGYDTQDLELDIVVAPDRSWSFKDWDLVDVRVAEGRFTPEQADAIRAEGERLAAELDAGRTWWDLSWASWSPPAAGARSVWPEPALPPREEWA